MLRAMLAEDLTNIFEERIKDCKRNPRRKREGLNPFQHGLMALFADARETKNVPNPKAISPRDRERIGKELWYAYRHYVPQEFLAGFLKQVRSPDLARRSVEGEIEAGFEEWIINSYAAEMNDDTSGFDARGTYPKGIEKAAERLSHLLENKAMRKYGGAKSKVTKSEDDADDWG